MARSRSSPRAWARQGFYGEFFSCLAAAARRPAVLIIGGSQGGLASTLLAALLAAHDYPALAIAYFKEPGLPWSPSRIPLEYFARALWLRARPQVDPAHVFTLGISFGSEPALLLGENIPACQRRYRVGSQRRGDQPLRWLRFPRPDAARPAAAIHHPVR